MTFFHVHPLKLFETVIKYEKSSIWAQLTPFYPLSCPPHWGVKIWKVVRTFREGCLHASNVFFCPIMLIKWSISIETCQKRLFSFVFYCFLLLKVQKTKKPLSGPMHGGDFGTFDEFRIPTIWGPHCAMGFRLPRRGHKMSLPKYLWMRPLYPPTFMQKSEKWLEPILVNIRKGQF